MMTVTGSTMGKTLPAELRSNPRDGYGRLMANQAVVQQFNPGGGESAWGQMQRGAANPGASGYVGKGGQPGRVMLQARRQPTGVSGLRGMGGLGLTAQDIANLIQSSGTVSVELLAAQNPGTRVTTNPDGTIQIYNQPTGTTANLPGNYSFNPTTGVVYGGGNTGFGGSLVTPGGLVGSLGVGGMSTGTLLIVGLVGVMAIALLKGMK